jgi:hypothetical protein
MKKVLNLKLEIGKTQRPDIKIEQWGNYPKSRITNQNKIERPIGMKSKNRFYQIVKTYDRLKNKESSQYPVWLPVKLLRQKRYYKNN